MDERRGGMKARGEALDCRVYAFAALQALISMGLSLDREAERIQTLAADAYPPATIRVQPVDAGIAAARE